MHKVKPFAQQAESGAHHPEPPSPIQTLCDNIYAYLSIFRNCGALSLARTICYTVQYNTIRHIIIWLCLTRTGNYQIHEFDWLKWILTAV